MKHIILLLLSLFILNVKGQAYQPFPDSNASWTFYDHMLMNNTYSLNYYEIIGKTIENGYEYTELTGNYLLREENKKIYRWSQNDQAEYLVYDFNLETGDSLTLTTGFGDIITLIVSAEDSILVGSTYHRVLDFGEFQHIEGIGSTKGPIYWEVFFGTDFDFIQTCFTNSTGLYVVQEDGSIQSSNMCTSYIGIEEMSFKQVDWYIQNEALHFKNLPEHLEQIQVFNLLGKSLFTQGLNSSTPVDIHPLNTGVYFGKIILKDKKELTFKFSKS